MLNDARRGSGLASIVGSAWLFAAEDDPDLDA